MIRRLMIALVLGSVVGATVYSASTSLTINAGTVGAGVADITSCQHPERPVVMRFAKEPTSDGLLITEVRVTNLDPSCADGTQDFEMVLVSGGNDLVTITRRIEAGQTELVLDVNDVVGAGALERVGVAIETALGE